MAEITAPASTARLAAKAKLCKNAAAAASSTPATNTRPAKPPSGENLLAKNARTAASF